MNAPLPPDEPGRLQDLRAFAILDTPPEAEFDEIAGLAAQICGTPIALITLLDEERQWFKSRHGIARESTPRNISFCGYALHAPDLLEVPDATADPRFARNPLVTGEPGIRFYAGAPLLTPAGHVLGTLCVMDRTPRRLTPEQARALQVLSRHVMTRLQLRRQVREQQRIEQALQTSEERWQFALEGSDQGVWDWNPVTDEVYFSPRWCTMLGYAPDEIRHRLDEWSSRVHPDDLAPTLARVQEHCEGRTPVYVSEHRLRAKDGSYRWVLDRGKVIARTPDGRPLRMVGTHTDITERRLTEEALRASESNLARAQSIAHLGSWDHSLATGELRWSDEVYRIFGFTPAARPATYGTFLAAVHPADREQMRAAQQAAIAGAANLDIEHRIVRPDGTEAWVHERGELERDASGRPVRLTGTVLDISARKRAEASTRDLADRLTTTLESLTDGLLTLDLDWRITFVNREAERMLKRPRGELLGAEWWTALPEVAAGLARRECERARREQVSVEFELHLPRLETWFDVRAYPSAPGLAVFFRDITRQRHAQAALQASERRYRLLFAASPMPMWVLDPQTQRFLAVNDATLRHYGYEEAEFLALGVLEILAPEDRNAFADLAPRLEAAGRQKRIWRHRKKDGTLIDVETTADNIDFEGRVGRLVLVNDVTERINSTREAARAARALQMLSRANEAMIRAEGEVGLLTEICRIAIEVGGFRMAWVGYAEDDPAKTITPQAHAGDEAGYLTAIRLSWDEADATGGGPAGRAIRTGEAVVVSDLQAADTGFYWHDAAVSRGYRGVVCLPLSHQARTLGMLALYLPEVRTIPCDELQLLQELAANLAFGIASLRARAERQRTHDAVLTMARGISARLGAEFFGELTRHMVEALGAHAGFIARLVSPNDHMLRTLSAVAGGRTVPNFEFALEGAPWADLDHQEVHTVPRDARRHFPRAGLLSELAAEAYVGTTLFDSAGRPIGLMFVLFRQPLENHAFVASILRIFAARVVAELERQVVDARTREQAALLDKAQDAILVRDLAHQITYWNKSAERLYGWTAAETVGRSVRSLLYSNPAEFDQAMVALLAQGEWIGEITQRRKDGRTLTIEGRWTLVRDEAGLPQSVLAINTDVTQRKALEQQFLRAQRMESIGTLAGGIAHDLNNLLAPIIMGIDLLKQFVTEDRCLPVIRNIERSARRGTDLVKQVLSFARGVEGARVAIHLGHLAREVESIVQNTFPKNIRLESDLPRDLWLINGDPTQLNQVLLNLCVNARDAMPGGGRIGFRARNLVLDDTYAAMNRDVTPGRYVRIEITDTGCGIPSELVDRIFEPFFTTKELGKGTGLGLSTVLGIVRSHGGSVAVASEVGRGSAFTIHLPALAEVDSVAEPAEPDRDAFPHGNGELVLVVDDEASVRAITGQTLEAFGYRPLLAEDGAQAIALYADHRHEIAVVLTDMMMPVMDGPALIAALRRIDPNLRIIAASGLDANGSVFRRSAEGLGHFLAKPYTAEKLLTLLKAVLASPSPQV